jgi:hypothetical protein
MATIEAKAFAPARDFDMSKQLYQDLGFELAWANGDLAYIRHGNSTYRTFDMPHRGPRAA